MNTKAKPIRITAYQADFGACYGYRLFFPLNAIATHHPDQYRIKITYQMKPEDIEASRAIILQRQVDGRSFANALTGRKNAKTRVIYEADDDFFSLPEWNPSHELFTHPDIRQNFTYFLEECDAIFVSTEHLAKVYGQHNKHVYVLPNSFDPDQIPQRPRNNRKPVVGWTGSGTHKMDFARVQPALETLRDSGEAAIKLFQFPDFKGAYQVHWVQWVDYYTTLALCDFDIGLAPLADHVFNQSKSNIKIFEMSLVGTPTIASAVGPYTAAIEHERTGLLIADDSEWLSQIRRLLGDPAFAEQLVANAREEVVQKYNIHENYKLWKTAIEEVCARSPKETKRYFTLSKSQVSMPLSHPGTRVPMAAAR